MAYTVLAYSYQVGSTMGFNRKATPTLQKYSTNQIGSISYHIRPIVITSLGGATPTNNNDYNCHIKAVEVFNQSNGFRITSHHTNSYYQLWGCRHIYIDICTETILQNQMRAGRAWFKNQICTNLWPVYAQLKMKKTGNFCSQFVIHEICKSFPLECHAVVCKACQTLLTQEHLRTL